VLVQPEQAEEFGSLPLYLGLRQAAGQESLLGVPWAVAEDTRTNACDTITTTSTTTTTGTGITGSVVNRLTHTPLM